MNKHFPLISSFYTKNTSYEEEAQLLLASCKHFDLECDVQAIASQGSWEMNCAFKPFFIYEQMLKHRRPLLWIDADASIVRAPQMLPAFSADLALRIDGDLPYDHPSYMLSGTLFIQHSTGAERLVRLWAEACMRELKNPQRTEEFWDQIALRDVLLANQSDLHIASLPPSYVSIVGHPSSRKEEAVIEHRQASRCHKHFFIS